MENLKKRTKIAIYCRVSTEEQAKYGYSIQAQVDELRKYAKSNHYTIVGEYIDEGESGGNLHRPALDRLLEDVKKDKIEMIIFVKLDRWFRSVAHYYKIQEILDEHDVTWKCTQEDYETETSSGKFKVNVMLSVNQQFKDATSERITSVFEYKRANGFYTDGGVPMGYKRVKVDGGTKLVINEEERPIVEYFIDRFRETRAVTTATYKTNDEFGITKGYKAYLNIINNPIFHGEYRGLKNCFPAYLSEEEHIKLQQMRKRITPRETKETYIFKGLLRCGDCGRAYIPTLLHSDKKHHYKAYRCGAYYSVRNHKKEVCNNSKNITEKALEKRVFNEFRTALQDYVIDIQVHNENVLNQTKKPDKKKIENKIARLNELYIDGNISKEKFNEKYTLLKQELDDANKDEQIVDSKPYEDLLNMDFESLYNTWDSDDKHIFYANIIDYIEIYADGSIKINFL